MSDENNNKPLSKEDAELWQKVQKTVDPMKMKRGRRSEPSGDEAASSPPVEEDFAAMLDENTDETQAKSNTEKSSFRHSQSAKPAPKTTPKPANKVESFDPKTARKISSGKQQIDAAIDLHGLTQREAKPALINFLRRAQQDDKRNVLVITGKGQRRDPDNRAFELGAPQPGVLKREVPNWLEELPDLVLSHTKSHQRHGGEGALYVRLRRAVKNGHRA